MMPSLLLMTVRGVKYNVGNKNPKVNIVDQRKQCPNDEHADIEDTLPGCIGEEAVLDIRAEGKFLGVVYQA